MSDLLAIVAEFKTRVANYKHKFPASDFTSAKTKKAFKKNWESDMIKHADNITAEINAENDKSELKSKLYELCKSIEYDPDKAARDAAAPPRYKPRKIVDPYIVKLLPGYYEREHNQY